MVNFCHVCLVLLVVIATVSGVPSKRGRSRPLFVGKRYPLSQQTWYSRRPDYHDKRGRLQLLFVGKRQPNYQISCRDELDCPSDHCCVAGMESAEGTCKPLRHPEQICMTSSYYGGMAFPMCSCGRGLYCKGQQGQNYGICSPSVFEEEDYNY